MMKRSRFIRLSLIIVFVTFVVGVLLYALFTRNQARYDNVNAVREASGLSIILPTQPPSNSSVIHHPTYEKSTGLITTVIRVQGYGVTFSQQKRPETDLRQVDAADTFLVNAGSVYVLKGEEGRLQAIVETPDSWLMINTDADIGNSMFKTLLESLETI